MPEPALESCGEFTRMLASSSPTPGGGGAAALMGALGASLCAMSANLTAGRKKFAQVDGRARAAAQSAELLRKRLLELMGEDELAFEPLAKAYSMDKAQPLYKSTLEEASLKACQPPLEIMDCCAKAIELAEEMLEIGNPMLVSDVGCAALSCLAGLRAGAMNVLVNTKSLDKSQAEELNRKVKALLSSYLPRAETLVDKVMGRLEG